VLVENNIHHDPNAVGDHNSLGIIDNYAKRIKRILTAYFLQTKKKNWIDVIQKIVATYNVSPHSSLGGFTPAEAMKNNDKLNEYLYLVNTIKSKKILFSCRKLSVIFLYSEDLAVRIIITSFSGIVEKNSKTPGSKISPPFLYPLCLTKVPSRSNNQVFVKSE
jgi:hypothetical protein